MYSTGLSSGRIGRQALQLEPTFLLGHEVTHQTTAMTGQPVPDDQELAWDVAQQVLEKWWYWLVIDVASVFIYWSRDLHLTSLLFVIYVILIPIGLLTWTRSMREHRARQHA